jgi:hypothetical protein
MIEVAQNIPKLYQTISNHVKPMSAFQPYHPTEHGRPAFFPAHKSEVKWQAGRHSFKSNADLQSFQRRYEDPEVGARKTPHFSVTDGCVC